MHPAIITGTVRSLIVDVAMGQIPRSTEHISSYYYYYLPRSCVNKMTSLSFGFSSSGSTRGVEIRWRQRIPKIEKHNVTMMHMNTVQVTS